MGVLLWACFNDVVFCGKRVNVKVVEWMKICNAWFRVGTSYGVIYDVVSNLIGLELNMPRVEGLSYKRLWREWLRKWNMRWIGVLINMCECVCCYLYVYVCELIFVCGFIWVSVLPRNKSGVDLRRMMRLSSSFSTNEFKGFLYAHSCTLNCIYYLVI